MPSVCIYYTLVPMNAVLEVFLAVYNDNSSNYYLSIERSMKQEYAFRTRIRISEEIMKTLKCTTCLVGISFESYFGLSQCFGWQYLQQEVT